MGPVPWHRHTGICGHQPGIVGGFGNVRDESVECHRAFRVALQMQRDPLAELHFARLADADARIRPPFFRRFVRHNDPEAAQQPWRRICARQKQRITTHCQARILHCATLGGRCAHIESGGGTGRCERVVEDGQPFRVSARRAAMQVKTAA